MSLLSCPQCHSPLTKNKDSSYLVCEHEQIAFPIIDGIPHLLIKESKSCEEIK